MPKLTLRDVHAKLPFVPYVCPDGRIVDARWALAINHTILMGSSGDRAGTSAQIIKGYRRQGYVLLEDLYEDAQWAEGYRQYLSWCRQVYDGTHREAFPEKLLPQEVLDRRSGKVSRRGKGWSPTVVEKPKEVAELERDLAEERG